MPRPRSVFSLGMGKFILDTGRKTEKEFGDAYSNEFFKERSRSMQKK